MTFVAMIMGIIGVVCAVIPVTPITQILGLILGTGALVTAWLARRAAARQGQPAPMALFGLGLGAAAVFLSGLIVFACHACGGAPVDESGYRQQFQKEVEQILKKLPEPKPSKAKTGQ